MATLLQHAVPLDPPRPLTMESRFLAFLLFSLAVSTASAQLSQTYYSSRCPGLEAQVRGILKQVLSIDPTMGASLLRLFFHDCFVNGCDASVLLDDAPPFFTGEKNTPPNMNSLRGFEIIDQIKTSVEALCKDTVSCADIVTIAARDSVALLGGPNWPVYLGRLDARTTSPAATSTLPPASFSFSALVNSFSSMGLAPWDMIALSGAHTIGQARCTNFRQHIYGDGNIDPGFAGLRRQTCPPFGGDFNLAPLDFQSPVKFDNQFYKNLMARQGLLHSDQELFNGGQFDFLVQIYSANQTAFFNDFVNAMVKMGNIRPLSGLNGEIRKNCRKPN